MKITVLGCGNAFSFVNFNQSFLIETGGNKMLIDCGTRTPLALKYHGIEIKDLDAIYISHAHADHIGGLEEVAFTRYDWQNRPIVSKNGPALYANEKLMEELWEHSLKGGLASMEGFDATLETFFKVKPIPANQTFWFGNWKFTLIQQVHIMTGSTISPTFGLIAERAGYETVYFTTDSQHCSPRQMEVFYDKADIIIQDCECTGVRPLERALDFSSGVHASYAQLAGYDEANSVKLSAEIKAKMWLSHYQDFVTAKQDYTGCVCDWDKYVKEDGFAGFVFKGQIIEPAKKS